MDFKIYLYKTSTILFILTLSCTMNPQGCGSGYTEINDKCYNEDDLAVLQEFINNSSETISMIWDTDSSGSIEPLELRNLEWDRNGRLTLLDFYDYELRDNYTLTGKIPENIGNLIQLKKMNLAFNQISGEIPESIGKLDNLDYLYLYHNKLSGVITDSICNIYPNLKDFQIFENQFCPPYPSCIPDEKVDTQDETQCSS